MTKHPAARRRGKSEEPDDVFIAKTLEIVAWAKGNSRALTIGGVTLLLLVAGTLYYVNYQRTLNVQATAQLAEIRQTVASGNAPLAIRDIEDYLRRFSAASAADEARLLLGRLYIQEGRAGEVPDLLDGLARDLDEPLGTPAAFLTAHAYEAAENREQAEQIYLRIAENARFDYQRREALADAAALRLQHDDPAGAAALYERILEQLTDQSPERARYRMLLAEARAMTQQRPATPG